MNHNKNEEPQDRKIMILHQIFGTVTASDLANELHARLQLQQLYSQILLSRVPMIADGLRSNLTKTASVVIVKLFPVQEDPLNAVAEMSRFRSLVKMVCSATGTQICRMAHTRIVILVAGEDHVDDLTATPNRDGNDAGASMNGATATPGLTGISPLLTSASVLACRVIGLCMRAIDELNGHIRNAGFNQFQLRVGIGADAGQVLVLPLPHCQSELFGAPVNIASRFSEGGISPAGGEVLMSKPMFVIASRAVRADKVFAKSSRCEMRMLGQLEGSLWRPVLADSQLPMLWLNVLSHMPKLVPTANPTTINPTVSAPTFEILLLALQSHMMNKNEEGAFTVLSALRQKYIHELAVLVVDIRCPTWHVTNIVPTALEVARLTVECRSLLWPVIESCGGHVVMFERNRFIAVFHTPRDALDASKSAMQVVNEWNFKPPFGGPRAKGLDTTTTTTTDNDSQDRISDSDAHHHPRHSNGDEIEGRLMLRVRLHHGHVLMHGADIFNGQFMVEKKANPDGDDTEPNHATESLTMNLFDEALYRDSEYLHVRQVRSPRATHAIPAAAPAAPNHHSLVPSSSVSRIFRRPSKPSSQTVVRSQSMTSIHQQQARPRSSSSRTTGIITPPPSFPGTHPEPPHLRLDRSSQSRRKTEVIPRARSSSSPFVPVSSTPSPPPTTSTTGSNNTNGDNIQVGENINSSSLQTHNIKAKEKEKDKLDNSHGRKMSMDSIGSMSSCSISSVESVHTVDSSDLPESPSTSPVLIGVPLVLKCGSWPRLKGSFESFSPEEIASDSPNPPPQREDSDASLLLDTLSARSVEEKLRLASSRVSKLTKRADKFINSHEETMYSLMESLGVNPTPRPREEWS